MLFKFNYFALYCVYFHPYEHEKVWVDKFIHGNNQYFLLTDCTVNGHHEPFEDKLKRNSDIKCESNEQQTDRYNIYLQIINNNDEY